MSRKLQECFEKVSGKFQGSFKKVLRVSKIFEGSLKRVSGKFQLSCNVVSREFQGVSRKF